MSEEVGIIEAYLQELNKIQTRISSLMPVEGLVKNHNEILKKRGELSRRIEVLFERMVSEYTAVCKEID